MIRILVFVFLVITLAHPRAGFSVPDTASKKPIEVLKNRLGSVQERLGAIEQLKTAPDSKILPDLLGIIRDSEDSIVVRGHIIELLLTIDDPWVAIELKKLLSDSSALTETKRLVLYALYKKTPKEMISELMLIAQNPRESAELRTTALSYLGQTQGNYPPAFWKNLLKGKEHPVPVRIAAANGMETLKLLKGEQLIFLQVLQDPNEPIELRKSIVLTAGRVLAQNEFEKELISIISKPENSLEIKRFALDNLASRADQTLLPQLKQIVLQENDPVLSEELKTLISALSSKS